MAESRRAPPPPVVRVLLPVSGAARSARDVVTETCVRWELPHLIAPATLIISELVANVVDHAQTIMTVRISLEPSRLFLLVEDGSTVPPVLRRGAAPAAGRGRGLVLIEAFSTSWGFWPDECGKTVWATVDLATATPGDHEQAESLPERQPGPEDLCAARHSVDGRGDQPLGQLGDRQ
ncbi:ATP-binding protein [Catenuloplanes sp. NPDC051500]|uniref:ATP-binding protein n=1 Tax=Catenuloplanes sp. NPDC051500 TaxID=3363959 RepID=UPI0037B6195A